MVRWGLVGGFADAVDGGWGPVVATGPILGGLLAAPLAGYVTRTLSQHVLMVLVGTLVSALAIHQMVRLLRS